LSIGLAAEVEANQNERTREEDGKSYAGEHQ